MFALLRRRLDQPARRHRLRGARFVMLALHPRQGAKPDGACDDPIPAPPGCSDERRTRIALAVIIGLLAGATRAPAGWLLDHPSTGC